MNNLPELKQIIADAPEGANEIDDTGRYWIYKGDGDYLLWEGKEWIENWSPFHTRSLADIHTIIEQAERIAELEQIINVQDGELDDFRGIENTGQLNVKQQLEIRDLEQQANGVGAFEKLFSFYEPEKDGDIIYAEDAISYCAILREQAKQLKGGAE